MPALIKPGDTVPQNILPFIEQRVSKSLIEEEDIKHQRKHTLDLLKILQPDFIDKDFETMIKKL